MSVALSTKLILNSQHIDMSSNSPNEDTNSRRSMITVQDHQDTRTIQTKLLQGHSQQQQDGQYFKVYPSRFLVVTLFSLIQMMTSMLLNTLTPIAAYLTVIYSQTSIVVNLGSLMFTLMHPIFTFPAAYVIDTYGTRIGISLGCVLSLIGVALRLLVNYSFAWVIVGQVVAGIGRPFVLNCQVKISASWFRSDIRGGVTQFLTLVLNVSLILGIIVPSLIFSGYKPIEGDQENLQQGKDLTFRLMLIEGAVGAVCFILNLLFQKDKPPTAPSDSASMVRDPFTVAMPKMMKNCNYLLLFFAFGCYFGIFNALSIILSFLLAPWFAQDTDLPMAVAAVGGSPIISGILGVLLIGPFQRRSNTFKKWILICMAGSSVAILLFYPMLQTYSLWLVSLVSMANSFFLIPLVPIMLELGCELVFPVGEGSAAGLLFAMGNFSGFLLGLALSSIVRGQTKAQSVWGIGFCFGIFLIGIVLSIIMKEEKNRQNAQAQAQQKRKSKNSSSSNYDSLGGSDSGQNSGKGQGNEQEDNITFKYQRDSQASVEKDTIYANNDVKIEGGYIKQENDDMHLEEQGNSINIQENSKQHNNNIYASRKMSLKQENNQL